MAMFGLTSYARMTLRDHVNFEPPAIRFAFTSIERITSRIFLISRLDNVIFCTFSANVCSSMLTNCISYRYSSILVSLRKMVRKDCIFIQIKKGNDFVLPIYDDTRRERTGQSKRGYSAMCQR